VAALGGLVITVFAVSVWLAIRYVPSWYAPPQLSDADLPRRRSSVARTLQDFTDRLIDGDRFTFKLSAHDINEWLAAREAIWPDADRRMPDWLHDPMLTFDDESIIIGARVQRGSWHAVLSTHIYVSPREDDLVVRIGRTAIGAISAPAGYVRDAVDDWLSLLLISMEKMPDSLYEILAAVRDTGTRQVLSEGIRVENRFVWPNGERPFRILSLKAADGWLTLVVEPMAGLRIGDKTGEREKP